MTAVAHRADPHRTHADGRPAPVSSRLRLPTTARTRCVALALAAATIGVVGVLPGVPAPLSALLLAVFVGVGPGCATLAWVGAPHVSRAVVVPALGLAYVVLVTGVAATVGWWHPHAAFAILALTTLWSTLPHLRTLVADLVP